MARIISGFLKYWNEKNNVSDLGVSESSMEDLLRDDAIKIITFTWNELMKKRAEVGARVYEEVLMKEVQMSRLFLNTKIDQQSDAFMVMLDKVIGWLQDPVTLDEKLVQLGKGHVKNFNVKKRHFKHFRQAFMKAIKAYIPWSDRREAAWMWLWNRIIDRMATEDSMIPFARNTSPQQYIKNASLIHQSFDTVMDDDPVGFATDFYTKLLSTAPDIAELFEAARIQEQGARFISMVRHCITLLDDHRTFQYKMIELGKTHVSYGVQTHQMSIFGETLVSTLKEHRNVVWSDDCGLAWKWFWAIVADLFTQGFQQLKKEQEEAKEMAADNEAEAAKQETADANTDAPNANATPNEATDNATETETQPQTDTQSNTNVDTVMK